MATKLKLVQNDTRPKIVASLKDETTGSPINLSDGATTIKVYFRAVGSTTLKATIDAYKLTGLEIENPDGSITIDNDPPYDTAGVGGRMYWNWPADALDTPGEYESEIEISFADGTRQTVYEKQKYSIRPQIG